MFRSATDPQRIITTRVLHWQGKEAAEVEDSLAVEEPLEVRLDGQPLAVIMRTPGHDDELVAGFLHGEGIVHCREDMQELRLWRDDRGEIAQNLVTVRLANTAAPFDGGWQRQFFATSSCGMCGKASIEAALRLAPPLARPAEIVPGHFYSMPERLRRAQSVFDKTGGLHAAGLFSMEGSLLAVREDVGRHNAVDKLIGRALLDGDLPLSDRVLLVSGRISFEIIQKALVARIPVLAAVSAPSSLAVQTARRCQIRLIGFLRGGRLNVYA